MSSLLKRKKKSHLPLDELPIRAAVFNCEPHALRGWSYWTKGSFLNLFLFIYLLATLHSMWDLSSLALD